MSRRLLWAGASLGVAAGLVQATVGARIPDWTGAKAEPVGLGVLTVVLSLLVAGCAWWWRRPEQLVPPAVAAVCALIGFTTVGRLWYVPGPLVLAGALLGVPDWRVAGRRTRRAWSRVLLAALGGCDLLLAVSASSWPAAVGALSGVALVAAAVTAGGRRRATVTLVALGTVPFAVAAATAVVPVLVLVVAWVVLAFALTAPTARVPVAVR